MATAQERAQAIWWYVETNSLIQVQRNFRRVFQKDPPSRNTIKTWKQHFLPTGSVVKLHGGGNVRVSEERVAAVRQAYERSPRKSVRQAARELQMPKSTVHKILHRSLGFHAYKLQLVHELKPDDGNKRQAFAIDMLQHIDEDPTFLTRIAFSDEATFHLLGKVNAHNARIWGALTAWSPWERRLCFLLPFVMRLLLCGLRYSPLGGGDPASLVHVILQPLKPGEKKSITNSNKKPASNENQHIYTDYEEHQRPAEERENTEKEEKEAGWKTQHPRERGPNRRQETQARSIIGTRNDSDDLQAAEKMAWLYIGRLKKSTTPETVAKYLKRNGIQGNIICEELHNLGGKKAFKVGFPFNHIEETERSDFWPQGEFKTKEITMDTWELHFKEILNYQHKEKSHQPPKRETMQQPPLITRKEIEETITAAKNKKAAGPDDIYMEHKRTPYI
ncbi:hypothetical protein ANN_16009 [Periplaneta americana]|uniref:DUF4817 domain-containing protein n=1 Tax=Periplaneta americana TaxID=6978 RepID=A0ABQ8SI18_PERAM|nr:hypothetical protein ANN_16009 [Periplaneta americana]